MSTTTFLNIQVNFDKLYQFNLLRDNLTWQQLSTIIQSSIPEAAAKESFSLYYTLDDGKLQTIHNQDEFSQLLSVNSDNLLGLRLYGENKDAMKSVYILPDTNSAFKKLSEFVDLHYHELEFSFCLSRMVGILATHIVYAPENKEDFDERFSQLEKLVNCRSTDRSEFRKMMKERKHLWKRSLHRDGRMSERWARHHGYLSEDNKNDNADNDNESFEFVSSASAKEDYHGRRFGRRGHHDRKHYFRRCGSGDDNLDLKSENPTRGTDNKEKETKNEGKNNMEGDSSSSSELEDLCHSFGIRSGLSCHGGRGMRHHFNPAEFQEYSGERHHRHHRRHGHGGHGFGGPGFDGGRGFEFGGKHYPNHPHHCRRKEPSATDLESFPNGFGPGDRHHRHGRKKFGGKKYFVFS